MASGDSFEVGDLVWAKMKGFSPWPARIVEPKKDVKRPAIKKPMQYVFFFGSDNYAWIQEEFIKHYEPNKDDQLKKNKSANFREAIDKIEEYLKKHPKPIKSTQPVQDAVSSSTAISSSSEISATPVSAVSMTSASSASDPELSAIFPSSSNKSSHLRDYSRTPFLGKSKVSGDIKRKRMLKIEKKTKPKQDTLRVKLSVAKKPFSSLVKKQKRLGVSHSSSHWSSSGYSALNSISYPNTSKSLASLFLSGTSAKQSVSMMRPSYVPRPVTPPPVIERLTDMQRQVNFKASGLKFGFLGLGIMGRGIVKNLINSGHSVTVWNRTPSKCQDFIVAGAVRGKSPGDVVALSDITFCCVSDPYASKEMVFGMSGALQSINSNKGYVEMTSIDPETSQDISEAVIARGGRFLEAPVCGSKKAAESGTLIILAAGDRSLFNDCSPCFQAIGKHAFYLGQIGSGCKMNLVINMMLGTMLAGLAEAMALADRTGLSLKDMVEVLELSSLNCPVIKEKGRAIIEGTFPTSMPLQHMQKDLHLALGIGNQLDQPLPLTAAANEVFKHAKKLSYGEHDVSAVYLRARF